VPTNQFLRFVLFLAAVVLLVILIFVVLRTVVA
jgi:hypothetical protein